MAANDTTWTEKLILDLRRLWDAGHPTAEIGRRLGITKNAVVGKAHRLDLPHRPSPIRRGEGPTQPRAPKPKVVPPTRPLPAAPAQAVPVQVAPSLPRMPRPTPAMPSRRGNSQPCCWPLGEPGRPGFRFCDAPVDGGKPYCAEHRALAYVKPKRAEAENQAA